MSTPNRAATLTKTHKVLKRFYKHTPLKGEQPVMESLLFACYLENARHDAAHKAFVNVQAAFFDWNEIRVSTTPDQRWAVATHRYSGPLPQMSASGRLFSFQRRAG